MKKHVLFLTVALLCSVISFSQSGIFQPKNIGGSAVTSVTKYSSGSTMDITFSLTYNAQDDESIDFTSLTFPSGFTVNSATNSVVGLPLNTISGSTVSWGANLNDGVPPANVYVPYSGNNSITCNTLTKLCSHNGCGVSYTDNANGYTVIYPEGNSAIHLKGYYNTEACCDGVSIYKGVGTGGIEIGGGRGYGPIDCIGDPGQPVTVYFFADYSVTSSGFSINVYPETIDFTVNLTISPGTNGNQLIPWTISGNMYGGTPNDLTGDLILEQLPMQIQINPVSPTCGLSDGSLSVTVMNGTAPYNYLWSDAAHSTTSSISGLDVGIYRVTVVDNFGLRDSAEFVLNNVSGPTVNVSAIANPCSGTTNGSISVFAVGTGPFTYLWTDNSTNDTLSNIGHGIYFVTVTDEGTTCKQIESYLLEPLPSIITSMAKTDLLCSYSTSGGMANVTVSGGLAPYTYLWSNGGGTTNVSSNPQVGVNYITITDANNCQVVDSVRINIPDTLHITSDLYNVSCFGQNDGEISLSVSGGTPGYSYIWSVSSFNNYVYDLLPGTYHVTVSDLNNCTETASFIITEPPLFTAVLHSYDATCGSNNGAAAVIATGGISPYTYYWDDPGNSVIDSLSGLAAGVYHASAYDYNGCSVMNTAIINSIGGPSDTVYTIDATCSSTNNGKAWVHVNSGIPPYTYVWLNNPSVTDTAYNLYSGQYTVTVTDYNGCSTITTFEIKEPYISFTKTNPTCQNNWNGFISANVVGGTPPYTYNWNGPVNSLDQSISWAPVGSYWVTVTDNLGCYLYGYEELTAPLGPAFSFGTVTDPTCYGYSDGSIQVSIAGGIQPLQYYWYNDNNNIYGTTKDLLNIPSGPYYYEITDSIGCYFNFGPVYVNDPPQIWMSFNTVNPNCGVNDGSINVYANDGFQPYSYNWTNGDTGSYISNLNTGIYTVIATDAHGCFYRDSTTLISGNFYFYDNTTNVTCNGGSDGSILLQEGGGKTLYDFIWSNGATGFHPTGLTAGTYSVTINDNWGCTDIMVINVSQPEEIQINFDLGNVNCHGESSGFIDIWNIWGGTINGGGNGTNGGAKWNMNNGHSHPKNVSDYTVEWYFEGNLISTDAFIYDISVGTYTAIITDFIGCTKTYNFTITEPYLNYASVVTPISCYGLSDGVIEINATTEVGTLTYSIDDGVTFQDSNIFDSLPLGSYDVYTQVNGDYTCQQYQGILQITQPDTLGGSVTSTQVLCHGGNTGTITVTGIGGTAPYGYSINGGTLQETPVFTDIQAGNYTVAVTDYRGCIFDIPGGITVTEIPQLTVALTTTPVSCFGGNNGTITSAVSGGTAPFTYLWSNNQTTSSVSGLTAASYSVVVEDANNCLFVTTASVSEPLAVSATITSTNVTCNGSNDGTATVSAIGGNNAYTYLWSTGGTSNMETGLGVATYAVTVTDGNSCSDTVTVTITEPTVLSATVTGTDILCNGAATGSATVVPAGGTLPYLYLWSNAETTSTITNLTASSYDVTVKDNNNCTVSYTVTLTEPASLSVSVTSTDVLCNGSASGTATATVSGGTGSYTYLWSNDSTGISITGLLAGTYTVVVTDGNNCTVGGSVLISQSTLLAVNVSGTNLSCNGAGDGAAIATVAGGFGPYSYYWSNLANTSTISGLIAGIYTVTVTDGYNCSGTASVTITQPAVLTATAIATDVLCFGDNNNGTITVNGSGGVPPYLYTVNTNSQSNALFSGLAIGTYSVAITDVSGCNYQIPGGVTVGQPAVLTAVLTSSPVLCFGGNTGSITSSVNGGVAPYTYLWSNDMTTSGISNLTSGSYSVVVRDYNNCIILKAVNVTEPAQLTTSITGTNVLCNNTSTGTAEVTATGGVGSYTYLWSNSATTSSISGLAVSTYFVTVKDGNNCSVTDTIIITEPALLSISLASTVSACNICSGTATVTSAGGTTPYSYNWSNNDVLQTADSLCAGVADVTVTDVNGCTASGNISISSQALSNISGEVHWSGGMLADNTAEVEFYKITNLTQAELAYTLPLVASQFSISNIDYGQYFLKVNVIDGTNLPNVLSTYLDSIHLWELADTLFIACASNYDLQVPMYEVTQPAGNPIGIISGYINYVQTTGGKGISATDGVNLAGEPVPGAEIYVELEPDDQPIINTTTNDTGFYFVSGLEGGNSYSLSVDIPGLPMISTYSHITINADSMVHNLLNFWVDTSETHGGIFINASNAVVIHENDKFKLEMYPNPFNEYLNISYTLNKSGNVLLEIYDVNGKIVSTLVNEKQKDGPYSYEFNASAVNLAEGTYIVKLQVDNTIYIKKVLQIK